MTCREFKRLWSTHLPGELPPACQAHLSSCSACATITQAGSTTHADYPMSSADTAQGTKGFPRRRFLQTGLGGLLASLTMKVQRSFGRETPKTSSNHVDPDAPVEYIVIGSGPGGGPLACRLALAGHKVVLCEAGGDDEEFVNSFASVPFFAHATIADPRIRWDYFVRHYEDDEQQRRDSKYVEDQDGIYYPRVGALGGCALHAYLFAVYPSNSDWDHIAELTDDSSWKADNMRKYFERLEWCRYVGPEPGNPSRHGFDGWQPTEIPDPTDFAKDRNVLRILRSAAEELGQDVRSFFNKFFRAELDPNDWRNQENREGIYNTTLFTENGRRRGPREFIKETAAVLPNNLIVKTHTLVTRILFDDDMTAIGIEYLDGEHLYRADPNASPEKSGRKKEMFASREVILAAGTFNSPQILKLSGIGPKDELREHGIDVLVDLPGVGENMQDRYEVSVLTELKSDFTYFNECRPGEADDPCYAQWLQGKGPYTAVGTPNTIVRKSEIARQNNRPDPDLFIINGAAAFVGYYPDYFLDVAATTNQFVWVILKGHTLNRAGTVKLRSADPRDTPIISFHYFDEGSDETLEDLEAMVEGVEFARRMNSRITDISEGEILPGPEAKSREDIAEFIRNEAWGHHASSTNKIGPRDDPMAVVDGDFRVHGTRNLRIVDASVFPRIPGYFILMPIYMISEKASDVILRDNDK